MEEFWFRFKFSIVGGVRLLFGYRPAEFNVVLSTELPDPSFKVLRIKGSFGNNVRIPHRISLGPHIIGYSCFVPDTTHSPSQLAGMVKRVATRMPPIDRALFRKFFRFVKRFARRHLTSLIFEPTETFEFDEWIENAPYTDARKSELKKVQKFCEDKKVDTRVTAHNKDEDYPDPKHLRGIYSRSDDYKCRVGPYFKKFGDKLFSLKWFIKKIPVPDRPAFISRFNYLKKIFCTDFSQFEATFTHHHFKIELWIYNFTLQRHPQQKHFNDLISKLAGINIIEFYDFIVRLRAKRMSGEMNTSCGNGLMNLLITFFALIEAGNTLEEIDALFEGDDGVIECEIIPDVNTYTRLGCNIKLEVPTGIHTASFCGNVFHPDVLHNVTNPKEASVRFGWTGKTYLRSSELVRKKLLKAKSLSMLYEYPGCPILASLAKYGLRATRDITLDKKFLYNNLDSTYEREKWMQALDDEKRFLPGTNVKIRKEILEIKVHIKTRILVEELYKISIAKQLEVEAYLDSLTEIQPLKIDLDYPKQWHVFDSLYGVDVPYYFKELNFTRSGFETPYYVTPAQRRIFKH